MRSLVSVAVVAACLTNVCHSQRADESGWYNSTQQHGVPPSELIPIPEQPSPRQYDRFNQPGLVRPAQHASPLSPAVPAPVVPDVRSDSVATSNTQVFTAEDYQRSFQPNYIPASEPESQYGTVVPSDSPLPSWLDDTQMRTMIDEPLDPVYSSAGQLPATQKEPAPVSAPPIAVPVPSQAPSQAPPTIPTSVRDFVGVESRTEPRTAQLPLTTPSPSPAVDHAPPSAPSVEKRRTFPISMLLLFASVGLNIYLIWIAFDTYNRYQDLVSDMRATRFRRQRRGSQRYADETVASSAY